MKVTVRIESATLGDITLESPHYADDWSPEGRAGLAAAYFDILGPRLLGALQIEKVDPEDLDLIRTKAEAYDGMVQELDAARAREDADIPELPNEDEPELGESLKKEPADLPVDAPVETPARAPRRIRDNPQA